MRNKSKLVVFFVIVLSSNITQSYAETAENIVMKTTDQVLSKLNDEKEALESNPKIIYSLINEIVIPNFDFNIMSKWLLGKNWQHATELQQKRFVEEFQTLLIVTYAKALLQYSGEKIEYLPTENSPKPNHQLIKTVVNRAGSKSIPISYRMYKNDENWKVIDIIVDSVSLVSTYRGSFSSAIKKDGFDGLINKLSEKNTASIKTASN